MTMSGDTYKVPNQSSGKVTAPGKIIKSSANPRKQTGGDLRSNGNKK